MRPGAQSSLHPIARHFLQEGGGLESHSSLSAHQGGKLECSVLPSSLSSLHTNTSPSAQPSAGRLRHSVLSAILQGKAETTAVVQLWNPAQPPTGPVPETGSQEELCMPAGCQTGWTPRAGAVPGLVSASCGKDCIGDLCRVTVTLGCLEGSWGGEMWMSPRRQERELSW